MKLTVGGVAIKHADGRHLAPIPVGKDMSFPMEIELSQFEAIEPVRLSLEPSEQGLPTSERSLDGYWLFRRIVVSIDGSSDYSAEEVLAKIKHAVFKRERAFDRIRREVEAYENAKMLERAPRTPIPDKVKMFVWQRDQGRCASCGSNEKLEFDHIIPVVKGGGNTERNIQLLCESCNRTKGASLG